MCLQSCSKWVQELLDDQVTVFWEPESVSGVKSPSEHEDSLSRYKIWG